MDQERNLVWTLRAVGIDVLCLILVFLPFAVLELCATAYHRGFFCDDESIRYPYKSDTVTIVEVGLVGILGPIAIILVCESVKFARRNKAADEFPRQRCTTSCFVPGLVVAWYKLVGIFLFGLAASQSITDIGKFSIGRLRPHFLDVCRPNATQIGCTATLNQSSAALLSEGGGLFVYITDSLCTGTNQALLRDARMSFPSGHSSLATYCAIFTILYLQARMSWRRSRLLRHMLQALCVYAAFYVCLSRISDYKHHPTDVLSGAVIGVFCAALTCLHASKMFAHPNGENNRSKEMSLTDGTDQPIVMDTRQIP